MNAIIWIYLVLYVAGAAINIIRGFAEGRRFAKHMEEHHPEEWRRLLYDQLFKKVFLLPFGRGSVVDFVWKSTEDYGDPKIRLFRHKIRWVVYGWLFYLLAGFLGFAILGIIFD